MNLIIQSTHTIAATHLKHLATLTQSVQRQQIGEYAYRMTVAQAHTGIAPYCLANQLDYGFVAQGQSLRGFGLLVMDMDSTLITIECIDEIADMQGLKPQVAAITEAAMRGEIDFAESLRRRVSLLEGLDEQALTRV
jgi:phosphoserine phosphatase